MRMMVVIIAVLTVIAFIEMFRVGKDEGYNEGLNDASQIIKEMMEDLDRKAEGE